eukprot:9680216-Heterocapsa_arctica.AAC.1
MVEANEDDVTKHKLSTLGASSAHRVPNQEYIKSYEHALNGGLGLTFHHFKACLPSCRPLARRVQ